MTRQMVNSERNAIAPVIRIEIKTNAEFADKKLEKELPKPKRLTDKEMRKVLLNLKKRAEKSPEEKSSFSIEVVCSSKDINQKANK